MFRPVLLKLFKFLLFHLIFFLVLVSCNTSNNNYETLHGNVFGTTFNITFQNNNKENLKDDFYELFQNINNSLSTYHKNSAISRLNNGKTTIKVDNYFKDVFLLAKEIHKNTHGFFDPTIGKTGNVWGFGPKKITKEPSKQEIDSLMQYVGFDKITLLEHTITKQHKESYLDFNAIAKGYGVDVIGLYLERKGVTNYLVEIGGEVRARGKNAKGVFWSVGIEKPNFDGTRSLQKITQLNNEAIATSGNYRKFRIDSLTGKKIAHTLNPKTGFPAATDLLSASVISKNSCAEADAYATAFMAMGFKNAKQTALQHPSLKVYFIYLENNLLKTYTSNDLEFSK